MHSISEMAGDEESGDRDRTFIFNEEGHTFGNALRSIIARYPEVQFCGYTVPHPSESKIHFRIQTYGPRAVDILRTGITDLEKLCDHTLIVFQDRMEDFKSRNPQNCK